MSWLGDLGGNLMNALGTGINHISNAFNRKYQASREDSTYQRTVADMQKAGISPLAMSGLDSSTATQGAVSNPITDGLNNKLVKEQINQQKEQTNFIKQQADYQELINGELKDDLKSGTRRKQDQEFQSGENQKNRTSTLSGYGVDLFKNALGDNPQIITNAIKDEITKTLDQIDEWKEDFEKNFTPNGFSKSQQDKKTNKTIAKYEKEISNLNEQLNKLRKDPVKNSQAIKERADRISKLRKAIAEEEKKINYK